MILTRKLKSAKLKIFANKSEFAIIRVGQQLFAYILHSRQLQGFVKNATTQNLRTCKNYTLEQFCPPLPLYISSFPIQCFPPPLLPQCISSFPIQFCLPPPSYIKHKKCLLMNWMGVGYVRLGSYNRFSHMLWISLNTWI